VCRPGGANFLWKNYRQEFADDSKLDIYRQRKRVIKELITLEMTGQQFRPGGPKARPSLDRATFQTAHTPRPGLGGQFLQQRLGVLEVGGVKAFGEPAIDFG